MLKEMLLKNFHKLPNGLKLYLRSYKYKYIEPEVRLLPYLIKESSISVDVGAHKGAYTYVLAKSVGMKGEVFAFEPIQELADGLQSACKQLRLPVDVRQCCLSSEEGEGALSIPVDGGEMRPGYASLERHHDQDLVRKVKLHTLDGILSGREKKVSFIKCDVEGHELDVFQGAIQILKVDRPNLLVEIEQRHIDTPISEHFEFFDSMGYEGYFLNQKMKICRINSVPVGELANGYINGQDKYINNFIFLPKENETNPLTRFM